MARGGPEPIKEERTLAAILPGDGQSSYRETLIMTIYYRSL
jgi:hypothetical protein